MSCNSHLENYDLNCEFCRKEYYELKGIIKDEDSDKIIIIDDSIHKEEKKEDFQKTYKLFPEEKAKELYQKLFLYYFKLSKDENLSSKRAKKVIISQCNLRNQAIWSWLR